MAEGLRYEVCPETGIGCVLFEEGSGMMKLDLMPDEVISLRQLAQARDLAGIKGLLSSLDPKTGLLDDKRLDALVEKVR